MWRKKNDDGAMGTRSLIRQNMKELRMQGIDLNKFESQEHLLYPPLAKDVKLKDLGTELDSKIINESYSLRDRQRRSMHYILFSKPVFKQIDTSDCLESDDLKKKLCLTILPKLLPNHVPAELIGKEEEKKERLAHAERKQNKRTRDKEITEEKAIKNKRVKTDIQDYEDKSDNDRFVEYWTPR